MIEQTVSEEWRPVVGHESKYEVSNCGRVRSLEQNGGAGIMRRREPLLMRQRASKGGYQMVTLTDGAPRTHLVHRLVLEAFVGQAPTGTECCHLNGDPSDNVLSNLARGSKEENYRQRDEHGRLPRGEHHPHSKLTDAQTKEIRARYQRRGYRESNGRQLAAEFNVSRSLIVQIIAGRVRRC